MHYLRLASCIRSCCEGVRAPCAGRVIASRAEPSRTHDHPVLLKRIVLHFRPAAAVLEAFVNRTTALTLRIYQTPSSPLRFVFDGDPELIDLQAWQIKPISKDRLTSPLCD